MHYTFWSHRREGVTKCVTLSQRLPFSIAFLQSYLKRDGDESISKGSVNIQNNNFWTAKVQPGCFPEAEQIPEVTREATPLTVLLYSPSCGPAQGQPDPGTARSQRAAPPSQTLLIPNSSLLGSRVFLSGTHPYGTWIIFCQERIRQYYLRPVNWPDSQRKLGSAGWVLPASKGLLHAVRTRLLARSESPSAPLHVFAQFFVSEALAVHKFAYVPFFFFICTFIVKKSSVRNTLLFPPPHTNSAKSQGHLLSVELNLFSTSLTTITYPARGLKNQAPTSGSGRHTERSPICIFQLPFRYRLCRATEPN